MDNELKRQIIMDNYQNPFNFEVPGGKEYLKINSHNLNCIDNIDLYILFDKDIIKDIRFNGEACAITTSSTSIMIKSLIGKTIPEALEFINNFENMIEEAEYNKELLNEAIVYDEIYKQQNRKTCAILPYKGLKEVLMNKMN